MRNYNPQNIIKHSFSFLILAFLLTGCASSASETNFEQEVLLAAEKGDWKKAAQLSEQWYKKNPDHAEANYQAATNYLRLNSPNKALAILKSFKLPAKKSEEEVGKREARLAKAYFMIGQYSKVLEVVENYEYPKMYRGLAREHLKALIQLGKFDELNLKLAEYQESGIFRENGKTTDTDFLYRAILNELILVNNDIQLEQLSEKFKQWILENDAEDFRNIVYAEFYRNDYNKTLAFLKKAILEEQSPRHLLDLNMLLGVTYARLGQYEKAEIQIKKIISMEDLPPRHDAFGAKFYNQARIETAMGKQEAAIQSLKKALANNTEFWSFKFKEDGFLKPLFGIVTFEELVKLN